MNGGGGHGCRIDRNWSGGRPGGRRGRPRRQPECQRRAPADNAPRTRVANVTVTLSPEARQHLSRLEGFTATVGTSKQPKQMAKPGLNIDFRT